MTKCICTMNSLCDEALTLHGQSLNSRVPAIRAAAAANFAAHRREVSDRAERAFAAYRSDCRNRLGS